MEKLTEFKEKYDKHIYDLRFEVGKKNEEIQMLKLNYDRMVRDVSIVFNFLSFKLNWRKFSSTSVGVNIYLNRK
jgi:hypothetical protein